MSELTTERLEKRIKNCIEVGNGCVMLPVSVAEELLALRKAAEKLVRCKGRYHSEQNYCALAALFGVTVPDLPPLPSDEASILPVSEPYKLPSGWMLVPIEPTENMIIDGFESEPDKTFSKPEVWEEYAAMSGCKQAAHRAKLCWAAMLSAAPAVEGSKA
ncbi:MAG: hypothetical protein ACFWTO_13755 [Hafnia paralvei]|jgi:hypothetical protein